MRLTSQANLLDNITSDFTDLGADLWRALIHIFAQDPVSTTLAVMCAITGVVFVTIVLGKR